MLLSVLPDTQRTPLDDAGHPGLVAVWRPMDVLEKAKWFDATGYVVDTAEAQVLAARSQLVAIEGIEVEEDGKRVPFDPKNPKHFAGLPMTVITPIYSAIIARTAVSEADAKN